MTTRFLPSLARAVTRQQQHSSARVIRGFVSLSSPAFEKKTMAVPTMGDSITEGTIVEWTVQVGQMVKEGDVVALVETDKVTVDIKADIDGVITQQFGAVDDTVEVGADLYELDTEAEATVEAAASPAPAANDTAPEVAASTTVEVTPATPATTQAPQNRVPSIQFLGKEGWSRRLAGVPELPPVPIDYGRPIFTEDEMEALLTGGANLVPEVKEHSSGAIFGS